MAALENSMALVQGVGVAATFVALLAAFLPHLLVPLAVAFGLPLGMYGIISLLELLLSGPKREQLQPRHRPAGGVLQMSRAVYEQLDGEVLQLLLSNRDFNSDDYERLMQLEALNEQKHEGATMREISQLPIVAVTESMLQATEDASCAVCLSAFQVATRVRMLRCFHRFHPDCIDPWLKDKAACPICKFPAIA